jgi:copper(I)-binding protein
VSVTPSDSSAAALTVTNHKALDIGASGTTNLAIIGLSQPLLAGTTLPVTFSFADAGQVSLQVPVADPSSVGPTS